MLSTLALSQQIIPIDVEHYNPEKFQVIGRDKIAVIDKDESPLALAYETVSRHIEMSGSYRLSPHSFNWNMHGKIYSLLSVFAHYTQDISLSSCRIDAIARDPSLADLMTHFKNPTITTAIEGISGRIRNFLQKSLTDEELFAGIEHILRRPFRQIKLYYIYTGFETEEDLAEFERFLRMVDQLQSQIPNEARKATSVERKDGRSLGPTPRTNLSRITVSLTPLLPSLGTPTQYLGVNLRRSSQTGVLHRIQHACARYGVNARTSADIPFAEFQQFCELTDRRAHPLMEYLSFCGAYSFPTFSIRLYRHPRRISKAAWRADKGVHYVVTDYIPETRAARLNWLRNRGHVIEDDIDDDLLAEELEAANCPQGTFYISTETKKGRPETGDRLYSEINRDSLFPEIGIDDFCQMLRAAHRKSVPDFILNLLPERRAAELRQGGWRMWVEEGRGRDYVDDDRRGDPFYHMQINTTVAEMAMERIKELLPLFTGGVTWNDLTAEKPATYIFPSAHIRFHTNQHIGQNFSQHAANRAFVYDSYCALNALGKCTNCGKCSTTQEIKSITQADQEAGPEHLRRVQAVVRDATIKYKLLVEAQVRGGPHSAITSKWLKHALT